MPPSSYSFNQDQLEAIRNVSMANLLCRNLDLQVVQKYAFFTANNYYNPLLRCRDFPDLNFNAWNRFIIERNYTVNFII